MLQVDQSALYTSKCGSVLIQHILIGMSKYCVDKELGTRLTDLNRLHRNTGTQVKGCNDTVTS